MMTDMDELDLEIYGPSATAAAENAATAQPAKRVRTDSDERTEAVPAVATSAAPAVYAVLCRSNGALEVAAHRAWALRNKQQRIHAAYAGARFRRACASQIATLPGWTNVYRVSGFTLTPPVLRDQPDANAAAGPAPAVPNGDAAAPAHGSEAVEGTDASAAVAAATGYTIVEVALRWIGRHPLVAPYLLVRLAVRIDRPAAVIAHRAPPELGAPPRIPWRSRRERRAVRRSSISSFARRPPAMAAVAARPPRSAWPSASPAWSRATSPGCRPRRRPSRRCSGAPASGRSPTSAGTPASSSAASGPPGCSCRPRAACAATPCGTHATASRAKPPPTWQRRALTGNARGAMDCMSAGRAVAVRCWGSRRSTTSTVHAAWCTLARTMHW